MVHALLVPDFGHCAHPKIMLSPCLSSVSNILTAWPLYHSHPQSAHPSCTLLCVWHTLSQQDLMALPAWRQRFFGSLLTENPTWEDDGLKQSIFPNFTLPSNEVPRWFQSRKYAVRSSNIAGTSDPGIQARIQARTQARAQLSWLGVEDIIEITIRCFITAAEESSERSRIDVAQAVICV